MIIETVARTGGHLASNLGAVELTIALHYVFDAPRDQLIWDVGHQAYGHKILTGRRDGFATLRQGRHHRLPPPRRERVRRLRRRARLDVDLRRAGHGRRAATAARPPVIAVIGDGALTGGMAFEALNNAKRPTPT